MIHLHAAKVDLRQAKMLNLHCFFSYYFKQDELYNMFGLSYYNKAGCFFYIRKGNSAEINEKKIKQLANMAFILYDYKYLTWFTDFRRKIYKLIDPPQGGSDIIGLIFLHKILNNNLSTSFCHFLFLKYVNPPFVLLSQFFMRTLFTAAHRKSYRYLMISKFTVLEDKSHKAHSQ